MGWLITLGVLILIAIVPIGVSALYNAEGPFAYAVIGPIRICMYPIKKKDKTVKKEKPKEKKKRVNSTGKQTATKRKGGSVQGFLPLVDYVLDFLNAFRKKLRVNRLEMKWILAGTDPGDLAINYGKAWAALGNLFPLLENVLVIQNRNVEVECDFLAEQTTIHARLDLSITIGRLLMLLIVSGIPILRELLRIVNKRKGGAKA